MSDVQVWLSEIFLGNETVQRLVHKQSQKINATVCLVF